MQVAALQQFLRSLVPALEAGEARPAARGLDEAAAALAPFAGLDLAGFAAFLVRADEYRRTGAVRVPTAADRRAESLIAAVARLDAGGDLAAAQAEVARAVAELAREAGLKGSPTPDPKWAADRAARAGWPPTSPRSESWPAESPRPNGTPTSRSGPRSPGWSRPWTGTR